MEWRGKAVTVLAVVVMLGVGLSVQFAPAVAAAVCPQCFGLRQVAPEIYADAPEQAADLPAMIAQGRARSAAFFGVEPGMPRFLVCYGDTCDIRLGGGGAKAMAYGGRVVHVSPHGIDATIIAHEFGHIRLVEQLGIAPMRSGTLSAWVVEGIVTLAADPPGVQRDCSAPRPLPRDPTEWRRTAGLPENADYYDQAACAMTTWMGQNGGRAGVLGALERIATGEAVPLE